MKNEVNSVKPYGAIPSQAPQKRGRCIDYLVREYSNLLGETPRIQFLDDDIVSAIGNNGTSVRSGFQVRILVPEHLTNRTEMCDFSL